MATLAILVSSAGCQRSGSAEPQRSPVLANLVLENHQRRLTRLTDFPAPYTAVMLGFTQCPDVCPTGLMQWGQALQSLPAAVGSQVQLVFVTVDPARDTAEALAQYVTFFHPDFVALRADPAILDSLLSELHAFARKVPGSTPGQYSMDHTASVTVLDQYGRKAAEVRYGAEPAAIAAVLGELADTLLETTMPAQLSSSAD